jgi:microcystin-dependent protein
MKLNIQLFASTNKTANYELPQFVGTDKPTWLGDFNEAMSDIDTGMHENATDIASMQTDVASATATASQASQDVATLTTTVNSLSGRVTNVETTASNAQSTANSALNVANTKVNSSDLFDLIYPVGSIYLSVNSTSPSSIFGGTWEQIKDTFLLGSGDTYTAGATGGEASHTLTINEIPAHDHDYTIYGDVSTTQHPVSQDIYHYSSWGNTYHDSTMDTTTVGGGQAHNNMPPYLVVNIWKRVS